MLYFLKKYKDEKYSFNSKNSKKSAIFYKDRGKEQANLKKIKEIKRN